MQIAKLSATDFIHEQPQKPRQTQYFKKHELETAGLNVKSVVRQVARASRAECRSVSTALRSRTHFVPYYELLVEKGLSKIQILNKIKSSNIEYPTRNSEYRRSSESSGAHF